MEPLVFLGHAELLPRAGRAPRSVLLPDKPAFGSWTRHGSSTRFGPSTPCARDSRRGCGLDLEPDRVAQQGRGAHAVRVVQGSGARLPLDAGEAEECASLHFGCNPIQLDEMRGPCREGSNGRERSAQCGIVSEKEPRDFMTSDFLDAHERHFEDAEHLVGASRWANADWATIAAPSKGAPRIVFFSIKGGVGRSTSSAVAAWALAESGHRVLVLDLDLESPGLSSSLLPEDRRPAYGITDWLVEDLVDHGDGVLDAMVATSTLSREGEIYVVPAHGREPGEYVAKLGRAWMPKVGADGSRETWSERLDRMFSALEESVQPDVILIDSRAGIDEMASACVTDLGAVLVLLFAREGQQTWSGYRILFRHWRTMSVVREIRERLQLVGAMIPEVDSATYSEALRERAWDVFSEDLYDAVPPGEVATEATYWNFDEADVSAPHYPWAIRWHRGFSALSSVHERLSTIDEDQVRAVFGPFLDGISAVVGMREE